MLLGFAILFSFQFLGEWISAALKLPLPGNVLGMALLLAALSLGWVKVAWIKEGSELLLSHMAIFFVPPGVAVMLYFDLISRQWLALAASTVISTFVALAAAGWTMSALDRSPEEHR